MPRITLQDFQDNYLVKDGMLGNALNLNKAPEQLKEEIDENYDILTDHQILLDILQGRNPALWDSIYANNTGYSLGEYVFWNEVPWKSVVDNNQSEPGLDENWVEIELTAAGGGDSEIISKSFIATEGQTEFYLGQNVENCMVFVDGVILGPTEYVINKTFVNVSEELAEGSEVIVIYGLIAPLDQSQVRTVNELILVESVQTINSIHNPEYTEVYVNGVLMNNADITSMDGFTITFSEPLNSGDVVRVISFGIIGVADIYTKSECDDLFLTGVDWSNVLEKDNTDEYTPSLEYHPSTKKYVDDLINNVYTKTETYSITEVENLLANKLDVVNPHISGSITETVYTIPNNVLDASNGTIQYLPMLGDVGIINNLLEGQYVTLHISNPTGYILTWPTINWVTIDGNTAPDLTGDDVFVIWVENNITYGAYVGSAL